MAVNTDNILFAQAHISADNGNPVLVLIAIADTDNTGINAIFASFILAYLHWNRKKILVLCQDLVQHKMRNFNYFQLTNSDSLATLAL